MVIIKNLLKFHLNGKENGQMNKLESKILVLLYETQTLAEILQENTSSKH